ncbi:hypothetical protein WJX84_012316 [Apatococcus fuscideae]|uniref:Uncharacterized protein n=1 Tax=Apatococcus fuscideae TaxID=2026836 RepID=A0AAW1TAQ9_9CHLO
MLARFNSRRNDLSNPVQGNSGAKSEAAAPSRPANGSISAANDEGVRHSKHQAVAPSSKTGPGRSQDSKAPPGRHYSDRADAIAASSSLALQEHASTPFCSSCSTPSTDSIFRKYSAKGAWAPQDSTTSRGRAEAHERPSGRPMGLDARAGSSLIPS